MGIAFTKGHGTENDFVLLDDPDGVLDLSPELIRALADRRTGIGGDGVIRVVRSARVAELADRELADRQPTDRGPTDRGPTDREPTDREPTDREPTDREPTDREPGGREPTDRGPTDREPTDREPGGRVQADRELVGRPEWFMDYWNADGSAAEMCGNGLRVFVIHLVRRGWIELPDGAATVIATRGGDAAVTRVGEQLRTDLGSWLVPGGPAAVAVGGDVKVALAGLPVLPGLSVGLSNPHVVVVLPDLETLAAVDLSLAPVVEPVPPNGTNVELVVPLHEPGHALGHLAMRVHERGSGETRSCGTGVVAAAVAARAFGGAAAPDDWRVDVPGGTLGVHLEGTPTQGTVAELTGPAVIVAEGEVVQAQ